jgi:hypothetical protein
MIETQWKPITATEPADNETVLTRIDDGRGVRNEARLYRSGRLWWTSDGVMYVYYVPTHYASDPAPHGRCPECNRPMEMHPSGNFPECLPCHQKDMAAKRAQFVGRT